MPRRGRRTDVPLATSGAPRLGRQAAGRVSDTQRQSQVGQPLAAVTHGGRLRWPPASTPERRSRHRRPAPRLGHPRPSPRARMWGIPPGVPGRSVGPPCLVCGLRAPQTCVSTRIASTTLTGFACGRTFRAARLRRGIDDRGVVGLQRGPSGDRQEQVDRVVAAVELDDGAVRIAGWEGFHLGEDRGDRRVGGGRCPSNPSPIADNWLHQSWIYLLGIGLERRPGSRRSSA